MAKEDIQIKINVTDNGSTKVLAANAEDLKESIQFVTEEVNKLNESAINAAQWGEVFSKAGEAMSQLNGVVSDLSGAYAIQKEQETKLMVTMRNRIGATDEEIESIKKLCAEQQKMGVIGDEVQLAGAQELATYLDKKESLEKLIPILNDMNAQQYGLNATTESSVVIAQMLGKVMEGQVGALSRYGYSFDEAQEAVLKFGTEEERVAMLVEVVGGAVGGVNEALAKTPTGAIKQLANTMGDVKEKIGAIAQFAMPMTMILNGVVSVGTAMGKLYTSFSPMIASLREKVKAQAASIAADKADEQQTSRLTAAKHKLAAELNALKGSYASATGSAKGFTAVLAGSTAVLAVVGAALGVMVSDLVQVSRNGRRTVTDLADLKSASEEMARASGQVRAEIDMEIESLAGLIKSGGDEKKMVSELNDKYGEIFGSYGTAQEWYDTLISKSQAYCTQLGYEAQARVLATQKAELELQRADAERRRRELEESGKAYKTKILTTGTATGGVVQQAYQVETKEYSKVLDELKSLDISISKVNNSWEYSIERIKDAQSAMADGSREAVAWQTMSYNALGKAISEQKRAIGDLTDSGTAGARAMIAELQEMERRHHAIGVELGLEKMTATDVVLSIKDVREEYEGCLNAVQGINALVAGMKLPDAIVPSKGAQKMLATPVMDMVAVDPTALERMESLLRQIGETWGGISAVTSGIERMTEALNGNGTAWEKISGCIDGFLQIAEGLLGVVKVIDMLRTATEASAAASGVAAVQKSAEGAAAVANASALGVETTAEVALASAKAMSAHAWIPFAGVGLAAAAVGAIVATMTSLPKFADGGVVYGPTLGLMGEYAGAGSNPEVVAPLDRLRGMIRDEAQGGMSGKVVFRQKGRYLEGVLEREKQVRARG